MRCAAILALGLMLAGCGTAEQTPSAPHYAAPDTQGRNVTLADLRGNVVLVAVWATWCPPCIEKLPELQRLHSELSDEGLVLLGVNIDARDADATVEAALARAGARFRNLRDPDYRIMRSFALTGVPAYLLIDRAGRLHARWSMEGNMSDLRRELQRVLRAAD